MERSLKLEMKVGIFIALGLVILLGSIIILGGDQSLFKSTYQLVTHLEEVQGLGPGSVVSVAGLPVGNVRRVEFGGTDRLLQVSMEIDERYQNRITQNSIAEVRTQGALGDKYIYIHPGEPGGRVLEEGDTLAADNSAGILEVISEKGKDIGAIVDVVKELHILLRTLNENQRSQKLMENMVGASQDLRQLMTETRLLMKDIRGSSEEDNKLRQSLTHLSSILEKVDKGEGTLGALVNNKVLHERILSIMGDTPRNQYLKPLIRDTIRSRKDP